LPKTTTRYQPSGNRSLSALHITRNHLSKITSDSRPCHTHKKKDYFFRRKKKSLAEKKIVKEKENEGRSYRKE